MIGDRVRRSLLGDRVRVACFGVRVGFAANCFGFRVRNP